MNRSIASVVTLSAVAAVLCLSGCVTYNITCQPNGEQRVEIKDNNIPIFNGNKADFQAALAQPNSPISQKLNDKEKAEAEKKLDGAKCKGE